MTELEDVAISLRYINRVRSMQPSKRVLEDLDQQELVILRQWFLLEHPDIWNELANA